MIYRLTTALGEAVDYQNPAMVKLSMEENAPAHSLTIQIPLKESEGRMMEPFDRIRIYEDQKAEPVFLGIIDEQELSLKEGGFVLTLHARSMAALLLDNEAAPQTYYLPSVSLIVNRHAAPYGFFVQTEEQRFSAKMQIEKGMSEWQVLEQFCRDYRHTQPVVSLTGKLFLERPKPQTTLFFSNEGGILYEKAEERILQCNRISEVLIKTDQTSAYSVRILNEEAKKENIQRKRLIRAEASALTPARQGARVIAAAERQSYEMTLICPGAKLWELGAKASLGDPFFGRRNGLEVAGLCYRLDETGERTEVILRKKGE